MKNIMEPMLTPYEHTDIFFKSMIKDDDPTTERGWNFEAAFPSFVRLSPDFATDMLNVQRFEDWARSPDSGWTESTQDLGIDFIITLKSGEKPIAVQTKFRAGSATVSDIQAFSSQVSTGKRAHLFSNRILVTNSPERNQTKPLLAEAARLDIQILGNEWFVEIFDALMQAGITPPHTLDALLLLTNQAENDTPLKPFSLRPHQEQIHTDVKRALAKEDATTVHAACGTGKTLTAWALMRDKDIVPDGGLCIIFTPALSLVDSVARSFKRQQSSTERYDIKAVCSDNTVNTEEGDISPSQLHSHVMRKVEDIKDWLKSAHSEGGKRRKVLVSTYQSAASVEEAMNDTGITASLIVQDEAHRLAGAGTFGKESWNISTEKRVALTATPRLTKVRSKTSEAEITSMEDESKFGKQEDWATYPISKAVDDGVLSPYVIEIILTPFSDDVNSELRVDNKGTRARTAAIAKICEDIHTEENNGKGSSIVFFSSKKSSKEFKTAAQKQSNNTFPVHHVDGDTPVDQRLVSINDVRDKGGVLTNIRVLNEGVDIPSLNAVVFGANVASKVDIVQSMGRALRIDPHNPDKVARIIVPIATNVNTQDGAEGSLDEELGDSNFSPVWEVLRAVCDHDDTMMRDFIEFRRELGRGQKPRIPSSLRDKIRISTQKTEFLDIPERWAEEGFLPAFLETITTQAVRNIVPNWYEIYEEVIIFKNRTGKFPNQRGDTPAERKLGRWCEWQRGDKRNGNLSADRVNRLEQVEGWYWDIWDESYKALVIFKNKTGTFPNRRGDTPAERTLGKWCDKQRGHKRNGNLPADHVNRLEQVEGWWWDAPDTWDERYEALVVFKNKTGKFPNKGGDTPAERTLGNWCVRQRGDKRNDNLSADRVNRLEQIEGWGWGRSRS